MKKLVVILLIVLCSAPLTAQIGPFSGFFRYEYRYQDFQVGENLTKYSSNSPSINIRNTGTIFSPKLATYSIFTSLSGVFSNTSSGGFDYYGSQFTWNRYNITVNTLQYSPVRLTLSARENSYDFTAKQDDIGDKTGNRQQEQRAELMVQRIDWLPTMTLSFLRTRSFATRGSDYDFVNQTINFRATGASDISGSYSLSAVMSDFKEQSSADKDRFLAVQFGANRMLSPGHDINVGTEYNKYSGYSIINATVGYTGVHTEKLRTTTSIDGANSVGTGVRSQSLGFNEYITYSINENFRCGGGAGYLFNTYTGNAGKINYKSLRGSGNLQHNRTLGTIAMANGISVSYNAYLSQGNNHSMSTSFSNSLSTLIGTFSTALDYVFSYADVVTTYSYNVITNSAGLSLNGILPKRIQSQSSIRYAQDHYVGNESVFRNQGSLIITQRLNGDVTVIIPLRIGLGGNFNRYFSGIKGKYYGWTANISSPSFFLRGVSADYTFSSNYDPYYDRNIVVHSASVAVNWRALTIGSRFRYSTFPLHTQEANVSVSRAF